MTKSDCLQQFKTWTRGARVSLISHEPHARVIVFIVKAGRLAMHLCTYYLHTNYDHGMIV